MKKRAGVVLAVMAIAFCGYFAGSYPVFAQETDDIPYLTDDDIAAIEMTLPDDIPYLALEAAAPAAEAEEPKKTETAANEKSRLNTARPLYHLLILDRTRCAFYADISGINSNAVLYKLKHGKNGYLIALYKSPADGPVFPVLPSNARILLDLMTSRPSTIKEYINSSAFRRFVTSQKILRQIRAVLAKHF
jgi:hypothetical protein